MFQSNKITLEVCSQLLFNEDHVTSVGTLAGDAYLHLRQKRYVSCK